jgi:hypothetical protein
MNKIGNWLLGVMLLLMLLSVCALFYRSIVLEDFEIIVSDDVSEE